MKPLVKKQILVKNGLVQILKNSNIIFFFVQWSRSNFWRKITIVWNFSKNNSKNFIFRGNVDSRYCFITYCRIFNVAMFVLRFFHFHIFFWRNWSWKRFDLSLRANIDIKNQPTDVVVFESSVFLEFPTEKTWKERVGTNLNIGANIPTLSFEKENDWILKIIFNFSSLGSFFFELGLVNSATIFCEISLIEAWYGKTIGFF